MYYNVYYHNDHRYYFHSISPLHKLDSGTYILISSPHDIDEAYSIVIERNIKLNKYNLCYDFKEGF